MATNRTETGSSRSSEPVGPPVGGAYANWIAARTTAYAGWLWALVVVVLLLDGSLTAVGIRLGLTELNPVAAGLIADIGVLPALAVLKGGAITVGLAGWVVMPADYRGLVPAGLAVPWTVAALVNLFTVGAVVI
ncbi:hypothetical protein [Haloplanus pelagicus]|jgi:hypothetical protein|uniref:hypothetical protein n=1 Tax=Haloplanus pelagicus TaxID=2949995 RepID=UPI002041CA6A|nr:hypothetical protein [Haloplanus sp. HW8-1]